MIEEEIKMITRQKHPGRSAQGHKRAALNEKSKEEILHSKEQSTEQQPVQSSVQSSVQQPVQSSVQSSVQQPVQPAVQSTVRSNDTYVYGVGMLAVVAIGVCIFFAYNNSQGKNKKTTNQ